MSALGGRRILAINRYQSSVAGQSSRLVTAAVATYIKAMVGTAVDCEQRKMRGPAMLLVFLLSLIATAPVSAASAAAADPYAAEAETRATIGVSAASKRAKQVQLPALSGALPETVTRVLSVRPAQSLVSALSARPWRSSTRQYQARAPPVL